MLILSSFRLIYIQSKLCFKTTTTKKERRKLCHNSRTFEQQQQKLVKNPTNKSKLRIWNILHCCEKQKQEKKNQKIKIK